ncbi:MAG: TlpA family protein disulfide reductase [Calditrichia bacterium]
MRKILFMLLLILLAARPLAAQGGNAPDFVLPNPDGENYQLSENIGEGPILLNFWATWCVPCLAEMKKLKRIHKRYKDKGLQILSITIDDTKTVGKVKSVVNSNKFPFTILFDTNREVFKLYQGENPPHTVLIDKEGKIVYTHTGYRKGDEKKLEKRIIELLDKEEG